MPRGDAANSEAARRPWQSGRKAKTSLLQVFRAAYLEHDARRNRGKAQDGTTQLTKARKQRRFGVSENELRAHLEADLAALLNTTHLESAIPLNDVPHVAGSIVNYGFRDLSSLGARELNTPAVVETLRRSLLRFEPRLIPASLDVQIRDGDGRNHHLAVVVSAELMGDPVDVPLDFDAEVDLGAGKMTLSKLRMTA